MPRPSTPAADLVRRALNHYADSLSCTLDRLHLLDDTERASMIVRYTAVLALAYGVEPAPGGAVIVRVEVQS